ncbi:MAG TPA: carboxypeptidase regulatory-like domain-containing protein [Caldilineae bacterium]|nr:carboxypeptidase regulatory-like domain-containing protein [Caldilineae bacterium]
MELHEYPRPKGDTGIGIHWSAGYPAAIGLGRIRDEWIPELIAMGVKWVKIANHDGGLEFAELLLEHDIMPIVRLYRPTPNPGTLGERELQFVEEYVARGVRYFEFNNEPDLGVEWVGGYVPPNALEIVARNAIIDMERILERGGYPAIPALATGSRWDIVGKIVELGRADLFQEPVWQAVHNYAVNHPPEYPDDPGNQQGAPYTREFYERIRSEQWGRDAWNGRSLEEVNRLRAEHANPGDTIMDDASCWRSYEFFDALVRRHIGRSIPVLATEGGWIVGEDADPRYPATTPRLHMAQTLEVCRALMGTSKQLPPAPDYFFCSAFWLIGNYVLGHWAARWESQAWYSSRWPDGRLPIVDALKAEPKQERQWHGGAATGGIIQGHVRQGAGRRLILQGPRWQMSTVVAPDESYRFTGLPEGEYTVRVDGTEIARTAYVRPGEPPVVLDFDLSGVVIRPQRSVIHGIVRNGAGRVLILSRDGWEARVEAGPDGSYRFENLAAGTYTLTIEGTDVRREGIELDGEKVIAIDLVVPGWGYTVRDMGPGPGFAIVRCSVEGYRDLPVRLWTHGWGGIIARTGTKTEYGPYACEFAPLGGGEYFIEPEGLGIRATIHLDSGRVLMVTFSKADEVEEPSIPHESVIHGRVRGGAGRTVVLVWDDGRLEATVGPDESYRFEGLGPGVYRVEVVGSDRVRSGIVLDGRNRVTVDFTLASPPEAISVIRGRVINGGRRQLRLEGPGGPYETTADAQGRFRFEGLQAGTYRLLVVGTDVARDGIVVDGRNEQVIELTLPAPEWTFTVRDGGPGPGFSVVRCSVEGKPNLPVHLWTEGWSGITQLVGSKAEYGPFALEFAPLGAGTYYVEPEGLGVRATVEVPANHVVWVEFRPATASRGAIVGRVVHGAGRQIRLEGPGGTRVTTVDTDERFRFEGLPPGEYTLWIVGTDVRRAGIMVEDETPVEVELSLPPVARPIPKLIEHYLLVGDLMVDEDVLVAAARYVARFQPEVGVDVERAQQARHVTILGGSEALSPVVEEALRAAECEVDRVEGDLATELRARVEAGRPW